MKKVAPVQLSAGRGRAKSPWLSPPERLTIVRGNETESEKVAGEPLGLHPPPPAASALLGSLVMLTQSRLWMVRTWEESASCHLTSQKVARVMTNSTLHVSTANQSQNGWCLQFQPQLCGEDPNTEGAPGGNTVSETALFSFLALKFLLHKYYLSKNILFMIQYTYNNHSLQM